MKEQLERLAELARQLRKAVQKNQISESVSLSAEIQALAEEMLKELP